MNGPQNSKQWPKLDYIDTVEHQKPKIRNPENAKSQMPFKSAQMPKLGLAGPFAT